MNYIFHVRHWNVSFFSRLKAMLLERDPSATFNCWTMEREALRYDLKDELKLVYLPTLFQESAKEFLGQDLEPFEHYLSKHHGLSIPFLYDVERYRPEGYSAQSFIKAHLGYFLKHITPGSILVSLTMDHFVFIASGFVNQFKGGQNFFVQPIGFPLQAQVIMQNPWELKLIRKEPLSNEVLQAYIDSLHLDPKESVHYMQPQRLLSMPAAIKKRVSNFFRETTKSVFEYLNPTINRNLVPQRFAKARSHYKVELPDLKSLDRAAETSRIFYFPLQLEPEMSILAYSPWFKNQFDVIRLLSQSLGLNDLLVLKENPKMEIGRSEDFYKEVSRFANVKWISSTVNSREIIRRSHKVISLTGTATIEAACLGINSLTFGAPPFSSLLMNPPMSEIPLKKLPEILISNHPPGVIKSKVKGNWPNFSRSIYFGNFTPKYVKDSFILEQAESRAQEFVKLLTEKNGAQA